MTGDDSSYFQTRAEDEIEAARNAEHPRAVEAHYQLAEFYLDRIHNGEAADTVGPALGLPEARSYEGDCGA